MTQQVMGVSELIGIAQAGGSMKDTTFKHSVIAAIGMASTSGRERFALGMELHRLRCAGQPGRYHVALALLQAQGRKLAKQQRWRKAPHELLDRVCELALREWLFDVCLNCLGRGRIAIELYNPDGTKVEHACDPCAGSGRGAPDLAARVKLVGVTVQEYGRVWDARFEEVKGLLDTAYAIAQRRVARRLGRAVEDA